MDDDGIGLPPELLEAFDQAMGLRDANGAIKMNARENVIQLIKPLLTRSGKLEKSVAQRLGGQPASGRAQLIRPLIDAVRALVGPLPDLKAWLLADASGGFDGLSNTGYRARTNKDAVEARAIGSPGTYLPRQLAQQRDDIVKRRVSAKTSWAQHTEIGVMAAAMLLQDMQRAAGAALALGPSWVIMTAVDTLPKAVQRKVDALANDKEYLAQIAEAVAQVTAQFESAPVRLDKDVTTSVPVGIDIEPYFEEREAASLKAATDQLIAAVDELLVPQPGREMAAELRTAAARIVDKIRGATAEPKASDIEERIVQATRYLDRAVQRNRPPEPHHIERLRIMLPHLWQEESEQSRYAAALLSANILFGAPEGTSFWFTGEPETDLVIIGIMKRIGLYVSRFGLPPADVPLEHLPFFAMFASVNAAFGEPDSVGIDAWRRAGAIKGERLDLATIDSDLTVLQAVGIDGLLVDRPKAAPGSSGP